MASLFALLSQQTPSLETRKGLILLGLQNDFLSTEGKLPVSTKSGFLDRLKQLVPSFREYGDVIWVRSEFEANRELHDAGESGDTVIAGAFAHSNDEESINNGSERSAGNDSSAPMKRTKATKAEDDEELFLTRTVTREPCCIIGSWGAEHPPDVNALVDQRKDMQVVKTSYSAFGSTSLLSTLRSKLITELYVCGCNTNLSVFATAMDAARYGIKITLIEDCLGFRKKERHDGAIRQLVEIMEADVLTSEEVIDVLKNPPQHDDEEEDDSGGEDDDEYDHLSQSDAQDVPNRETLNEASAGVDMAAELAVDSDDEAEEDMVLPQVRSPALPSTRLALHYPSAMSMRSPPLASDPEHTPQCADPAEPRLPGAVEPHSGDIMAAASTESESVRATAAHGVESKLELAGYSSITDDGEDAEPDDRTIAKAAVSTYLESPNSAPARPLGSPPLPEGNESPGKSDDANGSDSFKDLFEPPTSSDSNTAFDASDIRPTCGQQINEAKATVEDEVSQRTHPRDGPLFGAGNKTESAGSRILHGLLPSEVADVVFEQLNEEVDWQRMHHQTGEVPRLVCCQGTIAEDGSMPVYRHPSDQTLPLQPWSSTVETVRKAAEHAVGHPLNHALIQLYRGGTDYITEHSDKTLDIMKGSSIVNVPFGAQRTMRLRTKRGVDASTASTTADQVPSPSPPRATHRIQMPHNSMLTMSRETNAKYLHGINADKRPAVELSEDEKAYGGQRISLTFRHIATFLTADSERIWGQGATSKTKEGANLVINGDEAESDRLVRAFGAENAASSIDWETVYGTGSDVLHLRPSKDGAEQ